MNISRNARLQLNFTQDNTIVQKLNIPTNVTGNY